MNNFFKRIFRHYKNWKRQHYYKRKYGKCNKKAVILLNNCLAGLTYHDANEMFLSPTINLTIINDFLTFVSNYSFYINKQLEEVENPIECPRGILRGGNGLPDIHIKFTHYKTFSEAKDKWMNRVARFAENLPVYAIYTSETISSEELKLIPSIKCKSLIVLCNNEYSVNSENVIFIKIPEKYKNCDITSFKNLLSSRRIYDDFVDLYSLIYNSND